MEEYCYEEKCRYRHWTSGSVPTHRRGADCPEPKGSLANHLSDRLADELAHIRGLHANDYDDGLWDWGGDPYDNARATSGRLLAAVEAVLKKCDDYLKRERELPHEPFEFGMAEAARDVQCILAEKLGAGDER